MPTLRYVGRAPTDPEDITTRLQVNSLLQEGVSRSSAQTDVNDANLLRATKTYVDAQDGLYALPSYYQTRDALNVPLAQKAVANGIATLDANGKVPLNQLPVLGVGSFIGPFGPTAVFNGSSSGATPLKIADLHVGVQSFTFRPLVFSTVVASSPSSSGNNLCRPVVEARMSDGQAAYASQTLIGLGVGRNLYDSIQPINVLPVPQTTGQSGLDAGFPGTYDIWISLWLYDNHEQTATLATGGIASATAFLIRNVQ